MKVHQNAAYHIDKINLQIESPKFYKRDLDIINSSGNAAFVITSDKISAMNLPLFNDIDWKIKIYNGDNPPLKISSIISAQESQSIIAYLQTGKNYHLLLHDAAASKPVYDLQNFKDSIPSALTQLQVISFEDVNRGTKEKKTIISAAWLWVIIIVVLGALGFITYKLTKEMAAKNKDEVF